MLKLENGKCMVRDFSTYGSGLCILFRDARTEQEKQSILYRQDDFDFLAQKKTEFDPSYMNVEFDSSSQQFFYGRYFVSKSGNNCFEITEDGEQLLIIEQWGGCFNQTRGNTFKDNPANLYFKRASSHGGGKGTTYTILPGNWANNISEEDI